MKEPRIKWLKLGTIVQLKKDETHISHHGVNYEIIEQFKRGYYESGVEMYYVREIGGRGREFMIDRRRIAE